MAKSNGFAPAENPGVVVNYDAIPLSEVKWNNVEFENIDNTLPIGLFLEGERLNTVTFNPYSSGHDRYLGQLYKASGSRLILILEQFLPRVIQTIGGYSLEDLASKMSTSVGRVISGMYFGDIMTIILMLRKHTQETSDIAISATCPNCNTKNEDDPSKGRPYHTIDTVEVSMWNLADRKPLIEIQLVDGLDIFGDLIKRVIMQPLKLHQIDKIAKANTEAEDIAMIYNMVCAIPDSEAYKNAKGVIFNDELYDRLSRADLAALRKGLKEIQPGPKMAIEMECHNCHHEWEEVIGWGRLREFLYVDVGSNQ